MGPFNFGSNYMARFLLSQICAKNTKASLVSKCFDTKKFDFVQVCVLFCMKLTKCWLFRPHNIIFARSKRHWFAICRYIYPTQYTNWIAPSNNDVNGRLVKNQPKHCLYCQTNFFLTKLTTMVPWGNFWKIHSWENFQRRRASFFLSKIQWLKVIISYNF